MSNQNVKIRINLDSREIEIEGNKEFVKSYSSEIEEFLSEIKKGKKTAKSASVPKVKGKRGRPKKAASEANEGAKTTKKAVKKTKATGTKKTKKAKPGRPKKEKTADAAPKKRGRKPSAKKAKPAKKVGKPKKRGRKPMTATEKLDKKISTLLDGFKTYYGKFPKDLKDGEKLLVAAAYVQQNDRLGMYEMKEVNALLEKVGAKITNPSQYNRHNVLSNLAHQKGKRTYALSDDGLKVVNSLRG